MCEFKNKKIAGIKFLGATIGVIIVMGIIATMITLVHPQGTSTNTVQNQTENTVFSAGVYTAGKDFKEGAYNIVAVSGDGNVSSSNMYTGGMDSEIASNKSGVYSEYKDIKLPDGTRLTITGDVKIELVQSKDY